MIYDYIKNSELIQDIKLEFNFNYIKILKIKNKYILTGRRDIKPENHNYRGKSKIYFYELKYKNNQFSFIYINSIDFGTCVNHNFSIFYINNRLLFFGGQHLEQYKINLFKSKYPNFFKNKNNLLYLKDKKNKKKYNSFDSLPDDIWDFIINPDVYCPFYGNGLYLFELSDDFKNYKLLCNKPVIHGLFEGRSDAYHSKYFNIKKKCGLSIFDSTISILNINNIFHLYYRANRSKGQRFIQYTKSKDLKNWSKTKLIKKYPFINKNNIYIPNFKKINDNLYIGLLIENILVRKEGKKKKPIFNDNSIINLYCSNNGIDWYLNRPININKYHLEWIIIDFIIKENDLYYFLYEKKNIKVYKIKNIIDELLKLKNIENIYSEINYDFINELKNINI